MTGGTYFSGGEGVGIAMRAMGIEHKFGVEFDDAIANVARLNGFESITANVCEIDPAALPYVDIFHASPVCKNASNAKADGKESPEDIETAEAVCRYIEHHLPRVFTLENVWGYRKFEAFWRIKGCLNACGYSFDYWHLNAADYGVPQTRKRLILIARRDGVKPQKPHATHTEHPRPMFETRQKWVGWYEAIEDLILTLPPSRFAKWQLERLPKEITQNLPVNSAFPNSNGKKHNETSEPSFVVDGLSLAHTRALLVDSAGYDDEQGKMPIQTEMDAPAKTITGNYAKRPLNAFIVNTREQHCSDGITVAADDTPIYTLPATSTPDRHKAFIVDGKLGSYSTKLTVRDGGERFATVTASHNNRDLKAFLMPNENSSSAVVRTGDEPPGTVGATERVGNVSRVWLASGRVVKMTPRALARFQSFPDSYILPAKTSLACTVIGNAVPPKLYQAVLRSILESQP